MNNAKHFIKREKSIASNNDNRDVHFGDPVEILNEPLHNLADLQRIGELEAQHNRLHRAATVVLDALKRGEQPTAAMIYDLENAL